MKCPLPPWFRGEIEGDFNYKKDMAREYEEKIEYTCPEGYVFQVYQDKPDPNKNHGLRVPESNKLTLECAAWGDWNPKQVPLCIRK